MVWRLCALITGAVSVVPGDYRCLHISREWSGTCQHGAFSGIAVIVASFVPAECPKGGGMWGIFGKPLKRAFQRCIGWGGVRNHIFSKIGHYC